MCAAFPCDAVSDGRFVPRERLRTVMEREAREATDRADAVTGTTRRRLLAAGGAAAVVGLAGCAGIDTDLITGSGPAEFDAEAATVADATLSETGYELVDVSEDVRTESFEVADQTREVEVTSHFAEYDRAVEILGERFQAAVFVAFSTPQIEVLGRTFNPVGDMSSEDLAEMVQSRYDGVEDLERRSEYETTVAGSQSRVVQYDARADLAESGVTVDLVLHVADPVAVGGDFVVGIGAYPEAVGDGDAVRALLNGIEHPEA